MRKTKWFIRIYVLMSALFLLLVAIFLPAGYQYRTLDEVRLQDDYPSGTLLTTAVLEGRTLEFILDENEQINVVTILQKNTLFGSRYRDAISNKLGLLEKYVQNTIRCLESRNEPYWIRTNFEIIDRLSHESYWCIVPAGIELPDYAKEIGTCTFHDAQYVIYFTLEDVK